MLDLQRLAHDLVLYSMDEFGYFRLPEEFCTGSSIMPQKKNPDVLELVRATFAAVHSGYLQTMEILKGLPSGYHRDLQLTKEPLLRGFADTLKRSGSWGPSWPGLSWTRRAAGRPAPTRSTPPTKRTSWFEKAPPSVMLIGLWPGSFDRVLGQDDRIRIHEHRRRVAGKEGA